MARIPLPDGIAVLHGLEANRLSVIPDLAELLVTDDSRKIRSGDGALAGGQRLTPVDSVIYIPAAGHNKVVPPSGILPVYKSGGLYLDAIAEAGKEPEAFVVDAPAGNAWLGLIMGGGTAKLPNSNLAVDTMYFLSDAAAGALVTDEPQISVRVCSVMEAIGTERWVGLYAERAYKLPTTGDRFFVLRITNANFYATFGHGLAVIGNLRIYSGGTDIVPAAASVTPDSFHGAYQSEGIRATAGGDWGSLDAMPQEIVIDMGIGNEVETTHAIMRASGSEPEWFPVDYTILSGPTLASLTVRATETGHTSVTNGQEIQSNF